ncbi:RNA polymerase sigma-70 factor ECF subfamily [Thiolapillus brandeum]|uniref:RNA polymerase sigma-70 factor ECF subfamily n=2 Tax=Thiolapillus brandeum TaxID=1076588 RepID=A0A7U6JI55_9GAMM|nr:RNA polymerase sigma-70 factor ECF subfamily [Thiolapillus brandeum]
MSQALNTTFMETNRNSQARTRSPGLERFLADVERRALIMAEIATSNREEALDLVQDSMIAFVTRYACKAETEWPPLFYRILQNRIRDWYRRSAVRNRWKGWLGFVDDESDPIQTAPDPRQATPETELRRDESRDAISTALGKLPLRQQQAFMLRIWEGLDVRDTAKAMGCSQGSVKTHLFRAMQTLRKQLQEYR